MNTPVLNDYHLSLGARIGEVRGSSAVRDYGDPGREHDALRTGAGVLDLGFRGRLCLTGADRVRFLHGQVTNDIQSLRAGRGCYAALVTSKGKMESDLSVYCLAGELLLDFEPGLSEFIARRLERYIVADDVQVVDVAPLYGLLSVQGPRSESVLQSLRLGGALPARAFEFVQPPASAFGELYVMIRARLGSVGFDLFVPAENLAATAASLVEAVKSAGGCPCGWDAFETVRVEAGIPRFGQDMDETNIPLECGIEAIAVSYSKGCYIGQEVLNRIHSIGHVTRELRGLRFSPEPPELPARGQKLYQSEREAGYVTSAVHSPALGCVVALGYVRRESGGIGATLAMRTASGETEARVVELPFAV